MDALVQVQSSCFAILNMLVAKIKYISQQRAMSESCLVGL